MTQTLTFQEAYDQLAGEIHRTQAAMSAFMGWAAETIGTVAEFSYAEMADTFKELAEVAATDDRGTPLKGATPNPFLTALAEQMAKLHGRFQYDLVLLVGDNLYGSERPQDFQKKFEIPYKPLLDAGVKFYASLGNHDAREQRF